MNFTDEDMYLDLLHYIMNNGEERANERTGVGTKSVFGYTLNFDLTKGFPLFTTKKVPFKSVLSELLWFLEGSQNERRLAEIHYGKPKAELIGKTTIWTANADNQGKAMGHYNTNTNKDLGPVYGVQWRNWNGIDQIARLIDGLKNDPQSRRHILSAWNVSDLDRMALPPCHCFAQFYVTNDGGLKTILHQRSADLFLGVPFNIASYSLLTHMIAQVTGLTALELIHNIGDVHIYDNHTNAINTQLARVEDQRPFPTLVINPDIKSIDDFKMEDFEITGYDPHPFIPAPMAV
jgi:thymidylate synthase